MQLYVTLFNWTEAGIAEVEGIIQRYEAFKADLEKAGGRIREFVWTQGRYDGVMVWETPDDETASAMMLKVGKQGKVRTETQRAYTPEEMRRILQKMG